MLVLGIEVNDDLIGRWRRWLMPEVQPVVLSWAEAERLSLTDDRAPLTFELQDTFELYAVTDDEALVWVTRTQFRALPASVRHAQPAAHRWPRRDAAAEVDQTIRFIELGRRSSRHREVTEQQWSSASALLPDARRLAGTFPDRSGPNCFGTVMGAAGVPGAAEEWMQLRPFEQWLAARTVPGGRDDTAGTVLVWRTSDGTAAHAAVTIGGGWLLHKPSQGWMSPTKILTVGEGRSSARQTGRFLSRRRLA